ncbi:transketolase C-terminal domain-containing protein, partial [[Eubacterium] hominis]
VTVVDMPCIKPIDEELIKELAKEHEVIVSCEEHSVIGGLGSAIGEVLVKNEPVKMVMIGMQDCFGESGTPDALLEKYELDAKAIVKKIKEIL